MIRNHAKKPDSTHLLAPNKGAGKFKQTNRNLTELFNLVKKRLEARLEIVDNKEKADTIKEFEDFRQDWMETAEKLDERLKYKRNYYEKAAKAKENERFLLKTVGDIDPVGYEGHEIPASMRQADGNVKAYYWELTEADDDE